MRTQIKTRVGFHAAMLWLAAGVMSAACSASWAQDVPGYPPLTPYTQQNGPYDPRELGMLPRYCYSTQVIRNFVPGANAQEEVDKWFAVLGGTFIHLHHYCWGMMKSNRAILLAQDHQVQQFYLLDALDEYDYVIKRATPDFVLLPEILTKKAENLFRVGRAPVAIYELEHAIDIKPDYWPPYARLADHYKEAGQIQKARKTLEAGLKAAPDTPALTRRLAELQVPEPRRK